MHPRATCTSLSHVGSAVTHDSYSTCISHVLFCDTYWYLLHHTALYPLVAETDVHSEELEHWIDVADIVHGTVEVMVY